MATTFTVHALVSPKWRAASLLRIPVVGGIVYSRVINCMIVIDVAGYLFSAWTFGLLSFSMVSFLKGRVLRTKRDARMQAYQGQIKQSMT